MSRNPTVATTHARPWRESANGAKAAPVGRGVDAAEPEATISRTETMTISATTNHGSIPTRENRKMNMLQHLFGRRVGARCAPPAESAPGAKRRNATMQGLPPFPPFGRE